MTGVTFFIDVNSKEVAYVEVQDDDEDILDDEERRSSALEQEEATRHRDTS
jgi:hypothetical protein